MIILAAISPRSQAAPETDESGTRLSLGGVTVLQFRAAAGGFSPEERRTQMQSRVIEILSRPELGPHSVRVETGRGGATATIRVGPLLLVTATMADARANTSTPVQLANTWAQNFRRGYAQAKPRPIPPR
jgi:hypothetical protein